MTTTQQPEALQLADDAWNFDGEPYGTAKKANAAMMGLLQDCSTEIRRLHARVVELEADLQLANQSSGAEAYEIACEEMEAYQLARYKAGKEIGTQGSLVDGMSWVYEALAEAESQLEAMGAGGVESLRGAKPLTDDQIMELFEKHYSHDQPQGQYFIEIVRHAERAHKIGA